MERKKWFPLAGKSVSPNRIYFESWILPNFDSAFH